MPEVLIVLVIVILIFGPGRLAKIMGELGKGIQSFRESFFREDKEVSVLDTNVNPK